MVLLLIPFLELLNDTYTLDSYSPEDKSLVIDSGESLGYRWYSIEDLIDDTTPKEEFYGGDVEFQFISFIITGKK